MPLGHELLKRRSVVAWFFWSGGGVIILHQIGESTDSGTPLGNPDTVLATVGSCNNHLIAVVSDIEIDAGVASDNNGIAILAFKQTVSTAWKQLLSGVTISLVRLC